METFEFSIVASGLDPEADDFESRFYDAGCDDATVSFQKGHIIIDFAREAESVEAAIASALAGVAAAGAHVDRVEPDPLVSLADIAARTGMSRAAMSLYAKGRRADGFPAPVARVTSDSPLWDYGGVSIWLHRRGKLDRAQAEMAVAVATANDVLAGGSLAVAGQIRRRIEELEPA